VRKQDSWEDRCCGSEQLRAMTIWGSDWLGPNYGERWLARNPGHGVIGGLCGFRLCGRIRKGMWMNGMVNSGGRPGDGDGERRRARTMVS
jgi:hypothetical protein